MSERIKRLAAALPSLNMNAASDLVIGGRLFNVLPTSEATIERRTADPTSDGGRTCKHTEGSSYRCYLPVLAGLKGCLLYRTRPSTSTYRRFPTTVKPSGWEFNPGRRGFRVTGAPLTPRLALYYHGADPGEH